MFVMCTDGNLGPDALIREIRVKGKQKGHKLYTDSNSERCDPREYSFALISAGWFVIVALHSNITSETLKLDMFENSNKPFYFKCNSAFHLKQ